MKSRINWRTVLIAFLLVVGVNGVIEALPKTKETTGDILIDAAILAGIVGFVILVARYRPRRTR